MCLGQKLKEAAQQQQFNRYVIIYFLVYTIIRSFSCPPLIKPSMGAAEEGVKGCTVGFH